MNQSQYYHIFNTLVNQIKTAIKPKRRTERETKTKRDSDKLKIKEI